MNGVATATITRQSVGWSIILSVLMALAGVLAIVIPPAAGIAVAILVGWLLVFSGADLAGDCGNICARLARMVEN